MHTRVPGTRYSGVHTRGHPITKILSKSKFAYSDHDTRRSQPTVCSHPCTGAPRVSGYSCSGYPGTRLLSTVLRPAPSASRCKFMI
eukprot:3941357-Rhodomonas_salina.1